MRHVLGAGLLVLAAHSLVFSQESALQTRDSAYRIQPGDAIEVQYRYTPEFNAKAIVQPDGQISLPITGAARVSGLTIAEVRTLITNRAAERLRDPEVVVLLTDFVKPAFTVAGEVAKPGRYDLRGGLSVVDALAISGGFKDSSKHSQVILVRRVNDEFADVRVLDIKHIMRTDRIREDLPVQNGDLLIVPQNFVSKLERFVRWGTLYAGLGLWRR